MRMVSTAMGSRRLGRLGERMDPHLPTRGGARQISRNSDFWVEVPSSSQPNAFPHQVPPTRKQDYSLAVQYRKCFAVAIEPHHRSCRKKRHSGPVTVVA